MQDQTKAIAMTSQPTVVEALKEALEDANGTLKRWEKQAIADIALGISPDESHPQRIWNKANERRKAILLALEVRQTPATTECDNGLGGYKSKFVAMLQGYNMTFRNGWTVSVKFGARNYCENRYADYDAIYNNGVNTQVTSRLAEVAAWDANKKWLNDDAIGWQTTEQVADFIEMVRTFNT